MTTAILVGLIVVLLAAAAFVGVLLLRRPRTAPPAADPEPATKRPRTVADLVRKRTEPDADVAGPELFTPATPERDDDAVAAAPEVAAPAPPPSRQPATPAGGIEVGDAPWRRAARMTGAEPGGAWETAPFPTVAEVARNGKGPDDAPGRHAAVEAPVPAAESASASAELAPAELSSADVPPAEGAPADDLVPARVEVAPVDVAPVDDPVPAPGEVAPVDDLVPAPGEAVSVDAVPVDDVPVPTEVDVVSSPTAGEVVPAEVVLVPAAEVTAAVSPASPWTEPEAVVQAEPEPAPEVAAAEPVTVSRPLSDPELTPLMGIPIIRPVAAEPVQEEPAAEPVAPRVDAPAPVAPAPVAPAPADPAPVAPAPVEVAPAEPVTDDASALGVPGPLPRVADTMVPDDDVVFLLPPTPTASFQVVAPVERPGSPQPVWFRVVRRDGDPVAAAVVALFDDNGREVDTTKTAVDGGGELQAPHGGRFLMIVSADGYQPRAATLAVADEPVELALLLPRSAVVRGAVRVGDELVRHARVAVRQGHDLVDEALTGTDGCYRFDDLAEGTYTVAAAGVPGGATARVSLAEGADVQLDLDLTGR